MNSYSADYFMWQTILAEYEYLHSQFCPADNLDFVIQILYLHISLSIQNAWRATK